MSNNTHGSNQSIQVVMTPPDFMEAVKRKFGRVYFDLAASPENTQADKFYTEKDDGLSQSWHQIDTAHVSTTPWLWLNPPFRYNREWSAKCREESELGAKILLLTTASVGAEWFAQNVFGIANVYLLKGRLKFVGHKDPYPKDLMLAVFNKELLKPTIQVWDWRSNEILHLP